MLPAEAATWLEKSGYGQSVSIRPVGGGCINNGARVVTETGASFFLKTNEHAPRDMFAREAEGLDALRSAGGPRVPQVFVAGDAFLLLEDLSPAVPRPDFWEAFGRGLAALHRHTAPRFGFDHDNYLGSSPQPNGWLANGFEFYAERRLLFQARLAHRQGLLDAREVSMAERMCARLPDLLPEQPASLLHGDLWSGNAISDSEGAPAVIDPAVYYGWAEAELGMTMLFGGFPVKFYAAYEATRPLVPGWRGRLPVYNLYHLLNHLNLFGEGYHGQVAAILRQFGA